MYIINKFITGQATKTPFYCETQWFCLKIAGGDTSYKNLVWQEQGSMSTHINLIWVMMLLSTGGEANILSFKKARVSL